MKIIEIIRKRWVLVIIIIVLSALGLTQARASSLPLIGQKPERVTVVPVRTTLDQTLSASGSVAAEEKATVQFQSSGLMTWVGVKEGDTVKKYQALASLDRRLLQKSLQTQLNNYMTNRWDFEQTQENNKTAKDNHLLTDALKRILEKAQFSLDNSVINVEVQDLAIRLSTITSPIAGIVTRVSSPFAGVNIIPSLAQFDIVNPDTVYFSADIDETDISKIAIGQSVTITLDAFSDEPIISTVKSIGFAPKAGTSGTSYEVKVGLPINKDNKYKLGMNGEAVVTTKTVSEVLALPINAFSELKSASDGTVIVLRDGKETPLTVKTGLMTDDLVEVVSGLNQTDKVVMPTPNAK